MNKYLLTCFFAFGLFTANAQNGYKIDVNIKAFANQFVYLGYYFGKSLPIKDSIKLNAKGTGSFVGKQKLPSGIYLIGYPTKNKFFEILIDKNQNFSITADTVEVNKNLVLKGTADGIDFQNYQKYMETKGKEINALNGQPSITAEQKKNLDTKRKKINDEVQAFRKGLETKNPKGLLAAIFKTLQEPIVPDAKFHPGGKYDSTYAWYYYKSNYWNGVDFKEDRILRTPVFENKFDNYFKTIVYPVPDSIKKEADKIITASMPNKEMYKYVTTKLIERYINPEYMGQDAVYVHLFEKYVATGMTDWFDEKQKKFLFDRGYSLISNIVGEKAAPLDLLDTLGNPISLYNIKADYTVICFWDATCGHCKEVAPKLDSIYTAKWNKLGVKLLGVMTDGGLDNWKKYITEHQFTTWMHGYQPDAQRKADNDAGRANFRQLFDIQNTPKLFLLDKEKRIIAKQLTYDQLDHVIDDNIKKNSKTN
jgi:thiol-disulfide isomerase/thioredoxin